MKAINILTNDKGFTLTRVSVSYQHVISHYLSSKMGLWMGLFMQLSHRVGGGFLTHTFHQGEVQLAFILFFIYLWIIHM